MSQEHRRAETGNGAGQTRTSSSVTWTGLNQAVGGTGSDEDFGTDRHDVDFTADILEAMRELKIKPLPRYRAPQVS